jgi:hypothetical protein
MAQHATRRLVVLEDGQVVGLLSLGAAAGHDAAGAALEAISAAPPNR